MGFFRPLYGTGGAAPTIKCDTSTGGNGRRRDTMKDIFRTYLHLLPPHNSTQNGLGPSWLTGLGTGNGSLTRVWVVEKQELTSGSDTISFSSELLKNSGWDKWEENLVVF